MSSFSQRLDHAIRKKQTPALVGLDPRFDQLPPTVLEAARKRTWSSEQELKSNAYEEFCSRLIDIVAPLVPAVKPQAAFFEELGPAGMSVFYRVLKKAREANLIVICDAKRGDIGSTALAYANAYLAGEDPNAAPWPADALTINPWLGSDAMEPFLKLASERKAGLYILVKTSNPGSAAFQNHPSAENPVFHQVASAVNERNPSPDRNGNGYGSVGAVVGATWPEELVTLREKMPHTPLLIPGYGSQGGTAHDVAGAFDTKGFGALINSSRGINFAFQNSPWNEMFAPEEWEQAIESATLKMIDDLADGTSANQLRSDSSCRSD